MPHLPSFPATRYSIESSGLSTPQAAITGKNRLVPVPMRPPSSTQISSRIPCPQPAVDTVHPSTSQVRESFLAVGPLCKTRRAWPICPVDNRGMPNTAPPTRAQPQALCKRAILCNRDMPDDLVPPACVGGSVPSTALRAATRTAAISDAVRVGTIRYDNLGCRPTHRSSSGRPRYAISTRISTKPRLAVAIQQARLSVPALIHASCPRQGCRALVLGIIRFERQAGSVRTN